MVYADLHVHTNHSDGTNEIWDVLQLAKVKGVEVIAITDHDTIHHLDEVERLGKEIGIQTIRAVEMSCYDYTVHKKIHLVGLWLHSKAPHVEALCNKTLQCRDQYHRTLIQQLNEKGYHISYEDAKKYSPYNIVFKIHIFLALMKKYPKEMSIQRYRELFASKTSIDVDEQMGYIDIQEGITAIRKDGGIAIIAHPCEYDNYPEIETYVGYGLQGIEVSHPSMEEKDYQHTNDLAKQFALAKSGGSDYHDARLTSIGAFGLSKEQFLELQAYYKKENNQ